jgi:hypothetical protein
MATHLGESGDKEQPDKNGLIRVFFDEETRTEEWALPPQPHSAWPEKEPQPSRSPAPYVAYAEGPGWIFLHSFGLIIQCSDEDEDVEVWTYPIQRESPRSLGPEPKAKT